MKKNIYIVTRKYNNNDYDIPTDILLATFDYTKALDKLKRLRQQEIDSGRFSDTEIFHNENYDVSDTERLFSIRDRNSENFVELFIEECEIDKEND